MLSNNIMLAFSDYSQCIGDGLMFSTGHDFKTGQGCEPEYLPQCKKPRLSMADHQFSSISSQVTVWQLCPAEVSQPYDEACNSLDVPSIPADSRDPRLAVGRPKSAGGLGQPIASNEPCPSIGGQILQPKHECAPKEPSTAEQRPSHPAVANILVNEVELASQGPGRSGDRVIVDVAWERQEQLGDKATSAAALFVKELHPYLRQQHPSSVARSAIAAKFWRELPDKEKLRFVQKSRENLLANKKEPPKAPVRRVDSMQESNLKGGNCDFDRQDLVRIFGINDCATGNNFISFAC